MISPAVASPLTYLVAPSIEPKKEDSCCNFSRLSFASLSVMAPVLRSASIAICLPGIASSVNLAVTSDTRSEPLLITTNWTINKIMNTMAPITISLPAMNAPNALTTSPGLPFFKISLVDDTLRAILKIVVNKSIVGNACISNTSLAYKDVNKIINASAILIASIKSSKPEGTVTKRATIAASKYTPTIISVFFMSVSPFVYLYFVLKFPYKSKNLSNCLI